MRPGPWLWHHEGMTNSANEASSQASPRTADGGGAEGVVKKKDTTHSSGGADRGVGKQGEPGAPHEGAAIRDGKIYIAAMIVRNAAGEILSVRKQGTSSFMMPGGKREAGESARETVLREILEELGLIIADHELEYFGRFEAAAANEAGLRVDCEVFQCTKIISEVSVQAEIAEARYFAPGSRSPELAPLSRDVVFPAFMHNFPE